MTNTTNMGERTIITDPAKIAKLEAMFAESNNEWDYYVPVKVKKISKQEMIDMINQEAERIDFGGYELQIKTKMEHNASTNAAIHAEMAMKVSGLEYSKVFAEQTPAGATFVNGFMITNCDKIEIYLTTLSKLMNQYGLGRCELRQVIRTILKHEVRHSRQFSYLLKKGGYKLLLKVMKAESQSEYGKGVLESDAVNYQNGIENDFDTIFAPFINK